MSLLSWLRRRKGRRLWRKAGKREQGPLREFVYLDEVSVYSLVASQVGLVVTEVTETQASSLQTEVSARLGVSAPLRADVGSTVQSGESQSSQVLRKAIIQTTFKQLHDTARQSKALRLTADNQGQTPNVKTLDDVEGLAANNRESSVLVPPSRLHRGDLIEMDVRLESEPIFEAGMAMSGVLEIIQDDPQAYGMTDMAQLAQLRLLSRMLDKVLAGLIPVRGRALNYEAVQIEGADWLIHTDVIEQLSERPPTTPVFLVGVAQEALFWKDVRRVLFSESEYRVLARLNKRGLQESWTPVKLVDVLGKVVPQFADIMDEVNRDVLSAMSAAVATQNAEVSRNTRTRQVALVYASLLADRVGLDISETDLDSAGLLSIEADFPSLDVRKWREVLAPITELIEARIGRTFSREEAADCRALAMIQAGLMEPGSTLAAEQGKSSDSQERFLDSEIVAAYW